MKPHLVVVESQNTIVQRLSANLISCRHVMAKLILNARFNIWKSVLFFLNRAKSQYSIVSFKITDDKICPNENSSDLSTKIEACPKFAKLTSKLHNQIHNTLQASISHILNHFHEFPFVTSSMDATMTERTWLSPQFIHSFIGVNTNAYAFQWTLVVLRIYVVIIYDS